MEKKMATEVNATTGEVTVREFTEEEYANHAKALAEEQAARAAALAEAEAKAAIKAAALAKLAALGLSEEEAKAIAG